MKAAIVSLICGAVAASGSSLTVSDPVVFPLSAPEGKTDPSKCKTHDYSSLFDVPVPTGRLDNALKDYAGLVFDSCTKTKTATSDIGDCMYAYPELCGFATAMPNDLRPAYSSYVSQGSSWLAEHGSVLQSVAGECPHSWRDAMEGDGSYEPAGRLDTAVKLAQCLEEFPITKDGQEKSDPTATSGPDVAGPKETEESEDEDNGVGRAGTVPMLLGAFGLGAGIVNAL